MFLLNILLGGCFFNVYRFSNINIGEFTERMVKPYYFSMSIFVFITIISYIIIIIIGVIHLICIMRSIVKLICINFIKVKKNSSSWFKLLLFRASL